MDVDVLGSKALPGPRNVGSPRRMCAVPRCGITIPRNFDSGVVALNPCLECPQNSHRYGDARNQEGRLVPVASTAMVVPCTVAVAVSMRLGMYAFREHIAIKRGKYDRARSTYRQGSKQGNGWMVVGF